jgi:hypothetical protein
VVKNRGNYGLKPGFYTISYTTSLKAGADFEKPAQLSSRKLKTSPSFQAGVKKAGEITGSSTPVQKRTPEP